MKCHTTQSDNGSAKDESLLRILRLTSFPDNPVVLLWTTAPGRRYQVECKDDAGTPAWTPCGGPITAQATQLSWLDPEPGPRRFYRVLLINP